MEDGKNNTVRKEFCQESVKVGWTPEVQCSVEEVEVLKSTWCVTTVTLGLSRLSQEGICPLVTMKMCRTQGACLSTERSE